MAPQETLERIEGVRSAVSGRATISVTELSRSSEWRERLPEAGVMEITDRGGTAGWLLSVDDMLALIDGYTYLEEQLERLQTAALFSTREDARPVSGKRLEYDALERLDARLDELERAADDER